LSESVLTLYTGQRDVTQWQAIPAATQAAPRHPGGVIDLGRDYAGLDARLVWRWDSASLIAGLATEWQDEDRRGFENFTGSGSNQQLGVTGALRRDEANSVRSSDVYVQGEVELAPAVTASLGLRSGRLEMKSQDHYLSNGDDSGSLSYDYNTPVAALQWTPIRALNLYVSAGKGFETPTLNELAYRPDGEPGFNTALQAQTSRQLEFGAKWRDDALGLRIDAALFRADTEAEIGVLTNAGGRSTFQNVGSTRRNGAEIALRWQPQAPWRAQLALTWLDATYRDSFQTCAAVPCTRPEDRVTVPAGKLIAGTMDKSGFASLAWLATPDTELALELRYQGEMPVNDRNSDFSAAAKVAALRLSHSVALGPGTLSLLARIDNLTDRVYSGSVIVNEGNARYFETGSGRTGLLSLRWRMPF